MNNIIKLFQKHCRRVGEQIVHIQLLMYQCTVSRVMTTVRRIHFCVSVLHLKTQNLEFKIFSIPLVFFADKDTQKSSSQTNSFSIYQHTYLIFCKYVENQKGKILFSVTFFR